MAACTGSAVDSSGVPHSGHTADLQKSRVSILHARTHPEKHRHGVAHTAVSSWVDAWSEALAAGGKERAPFHQQLFPPHLFC